MVGISGQPSVLGFRRQKVGKASDQAESTADTCGGNTVFIVVGACSDKSERSSIKRAKTQSVKRFCN